MKREVRMAASAKRPASNRYRVPGLERGMTVLELLDAHPAGLPLERIAEATGIPKNGVFRVAMTLWDLGYLRRDEQTKYFSLSRRVLSLGGGSLRSAGLMDAALAVMQDLRDVTKETVLIGTLADGCGVVLEQVPGLHPFKFTVDPGKSIPLNAAAPCKAIMAFLPERERDEILAGVRYNSFNQRTITDKRAYLDELGRVRKLGYALDACEELDGVFCVAAPVFDRHGHPLASIWVTGPSDRLSGKHTKRIGEQVARHAGRVSDRLANKLLDAPNGGVQAAHA
jgi:IclR family acetate operon transcriptional repressor